MIWKQSSDDKAYHVDLKETHPSSWKTNAQLSFEIGGISLLELNLSELVANEYIDTIDVEAASEIDGNFYFIVRFGHLTTPGWFGSGQCGAGWEEWLAFIQVNNSLEIEEFEYVQNESCYKVIEAEYFFDKDHPEFGITEKKY